MAPCDTPSTTTPAIEYPVLGAMVNVLLAPLFTDTEPDGVIVPPVPEEEVMV